MRLAIDGRAYEEAAGALLSVNREAAGGYDVLTKEPSPGAGHGVDLEGPTRR